MSHAAAAPSKAVNVFFVDTITLEASHFGMSTVVGPPRTGTWQSGVLIDTTASGEGLGHVIAHELGHYLGLWHPYEAVTGDVDPLPDTADEAPNLMAAGVLESTGLTPQQRAVVLSHPVVMAAP